MAGHEAPRRQADRDRGEDHRQQCGEAQEALRLVERRAHFGAGVFHRLDALTTAQVGVRPLFVGFDCLRRARHVQPPGGAAAFDDQAGGSQILQVEDRARQQAEEVGAAVGFERHHRTDAELDFAEADPIAHRDPQLGEQAFVEPDFALCRHPPCDFVRLVGAGCDTDRAAQRVAVLDDLDASQHRRLFGARHAGEQHRFGSLQAAIARFAGDLSRPWPVGTQQQVAAQQLVGLAVQCAADAVGQEADAGQAGHGDDDRQPEQVQFTRAQVAQHHAESQAQRLHRFLRRPQRDAASRVRASWHQ